MDKDKVLKDGQYRKGLQIAFSNANNAAIELVKTDDRLKGFGVEEMMGKVREIRNIILQDYHEYYATVISKVGSNFKPADTIARLEKATDYKSLQGIFLSLSQDERNNPEVVKRANELKAQYHEKPQ